jgi:hypothetical protein
MLGSDGGTRASGHLPLEANVPRVLVENCFEPIGTLDSTLPIAIMESR